VKYILVELCIFGTVMICKLFFEGSITYSYHFAGTCPKCDKVMDTVQFQYGAGETADWQALT
jgi:hypothetical protein